MSNEKLVEALRDMKARDAARRVREALQAHAAEAAQAQAQAAEPVGFEEWMDRDWPLWRNDPDNPNVARLRRMWKDYHPSPADTDWKNNVLAGDMKAIVDGDGNVLYVNKKIFDREVERTNETLAAVFVLTADAERLAEALRTIQHSMQQAQIYGNDSRREIKLSASVCEQALAAHSAQAQPPAASVPDGLVDALRHQRQIDEDGAEVGVSRQAVDEAANILAMLAAVPQPPAARVPDWTDAQCVAFMAVGLRHTEYKKGKSPTVEEIRQGAKAALAAQENPNG